MILRLYRRIIQSWKRLFSIFIIFLITFLCIPLFHTVTLGESETQRIAGIEKEVERINGQTFERLEVSASKSPPFGETYSAVMYRDKESKTIRKIIYTESKTGDETGYGLDFILIEYLNSGGELIFLSFYDEEGGATSGKDDSAPYAGPPWGIIMSGKIYFLQGKAVKKISEKKGVDFGLKKVYQTGIMPRKFFITFREFRENLITSLRKTISEDVRPLRPGQEEIDQFQNAIRQVQADSFTGAYRFRRPEKGDKTFINGNQVNLREKPSVNSKKQGELHLLSMVTVVSVGERDSIGKWGTNLWYQVTCDDKKGWVFGAFLEQAVYAVK